MAACDRTYPRYYCKEASLATQALCAIGQNGSPLAKLDTKWVDYIDEISGTVCSSMEVSKCSCTAS